MASPLLILTEDKHIMHNYNKNTTLNYYLIITVY